MDTDLPAVDLSHPAWLRNALANPKKTWNSYELLMRREDQRAAARARSREALGAETSEQNPFSVWTATVLDEERKKRRFSTEAYDRNRVIVGGDPERYINATYIREGAGGRWWVAAEAPTLAAVHAFLSMFLPPEDSEEQVPRMHTVIQLSPSGEGSSHPPEPYFPSVQSHAYTFYAERGSTDYAPLQVQTIKQKRYPRANCTKTTFQITRTRSDPPENESFDVVHLLFESWPAKSVPKSDDHKALRELMAIAYRVNTRPQYPTSELPGDPPIVLHCAEGGRTGSFIAINSLLRSLRCIPSPYDEAHIAPRLPPSPLSPPPSEIAFDPVLRELDHLLDERPNMIDNENQLRFIYQMLWEGIADREPQKSAFSPMPPLPIGPAFAKQPSLSRKGTHSRKNSHSHSRKDSISRKTIMSIENVWNAIIGR